MCNSKKILIAGSGKIAQDIGFFLLKKRNDISWVSHDEQRIIELQSFINSRVMDFIMSSNKVIKQLSASFYLYDELENLNFDIIIECSKESKEEKRQIFNKLLNHQKEDTVYFVVSKSILPLEINSQCVGLKILYPLESTKTAELIFSNNIPDGIKEKAINFCFENEIKIYKY
jgi:3-hydroxyacyl-CoA dehydrogenase